MIAIAQKIVTRLCRENLTLATAESCTGGMIGAALTAVPGASECYLGGVIAYNNVIKQSLLAVAPEILTEFGAVSEPCVTAMAAGARQRCGADCAIATSGIAGPGGGSAEKPVGTVCICVMTPQRERTQRCWFDGDRAAVRAAATEYALKLLAELI